MHRLNKERLRSYKEYSSCSVRCWTNKQSFKHCVGQLSFPRAPVFNVDGSQGVDLAWRKKQCVLYRARCTPHTQHWRRGSGGRATKQRRLTSSVYFSYTGLTKNIFDYKISLAVWKLYTVDAAMSAGGRYHLAVVARSWLQVVVGTKWYVAGSW